MASLSILSFSPSPGISTRRHPLSLHVFPVVCKTVVPDFFTLLLTALPVSSWITGVALHKLTRRDGTTNGGGRRLQSENVVHTVATSNLELYLIINRVDHIEHFFRIVLFSIFIKLHAIAGTFTCARSI